MRIATTFILAAFFLAACGDGDLVSVETDPGNRPAPHDPSTPERDDNGDDSGGGNGDDNQGVAPNYVLEITSEDPLALAPYASRQLSVRLTKNQAAMDNEEIRFAIQGDSGGARLVAGRARTNSSGSAQVELIAGGGTGTFDVLVDTDFTNAKRARISVSSPAEAPGAIRVRASYQDQNRQPVQSVAVSVYDTQTLACADLNSGSRPTAIENNTMSLTGTQVFSGFADGQSLTVVATGLNQSTTVAEGCVDGVTVSGGEERTVDVRLFQKGMDPSGTYEFKTTLDTRGAIPGHAGTFVDLLTSLFEHPDDPARFLVKLVEEQSGFDFSIFRETAIRYVDDLIRQIVPENFLNMFDYAGDTARVVTTMSFEGTLNIRQSGNDSFVADEKWETVVFRWTAGCDTTANPGCDEHRVALRNTRIGEVTTTYPVEVDNQVLRIDEHDRDIEYARFFHLFIQEILYPYIVPGATNTTDLLANAVDCASLAQTIDKSDGTEDGFYTIIGISIPVSELENYCGVGLRMAGDLVDDQIDRLIHDYSSNLTLEGAGQLHDDTQNLRPDRISSGVWSGYIGVDGVNHDTRGTFEAQRAP